MKPIRLGAILENAARLAGRDAARLGVPANWQVLAAMTINAGITRIIGEKFPMQTRVEFRRYRPDWQENRPYTVGNEVWHGEDYWRKTSSGEGEPGVEQCWTKLRQDEVAAFIAWDQPWENTVIHRAGIDPTRFAYVADPKYNPSASPLKAVRITSFGIELQTPAPKGVYCMFIPEFPSISFEEWSAERIYEPGEVVYLKATKDVYECVAAPENAGESPDKSDKWIPIRIEGEFETYLTKLVSVDFMTIDQGKQQSQAHAEAEFQRLCEMYHDGNGETTIRRGRFR